MNKRLLISLFSLLILAAIIFLITGRLKGGKTVTLDVDNNTSIGSTTTSSNNFGCPPDLIPIAINTAGQSQKISCVKDVSKQNLDPNTYNLYGYYSTYNKVAYPIDYDPKRDPQPATITCPQFTILDGGNIPLIKKYEDIYKENGYRYLNNQGYPTFGINILNLTDDKKLLLTQSSSTSPTHLSVKEAPAGESGCEMTCCRGIIDTVSVQK
jgi:hypothetical protein